MTIDDAIRVEASNEKGAFWSTMTLLQLLKQGDNIPKGITRDYPKYSLRGFVLDVGRKMISMDYLKNTLKLMAWYKMNDLHLHLNDNYIFVERYQNTANPYGAYSAFRLESNIKKGGNNGLNKQDLTSTDLFYTKAEFKNFIEEAKKQGIQVVPEFDTPAHSLAFTKVRPDLTMKNHSVRRWVDHLEVSDPKSLEFVKDVWNEYIDGEDPTFKESKVIHIGVDEFEGNNEVFRKFTDDLLAYAHSKNKVPRLWGSLTSKHGRTAVRSENVQMNIWSTSWAEPRAMYKAGYKLINTLDHPLYIVPGAGYYNDFLDTKNLYANFEANKIGSTIIPAGSKQMLGAAFAIWNDKIDLDANGITEFDIYKRFQAALPTLATKLWGNRDMGDYESFQNKVKLIGEPVNHNPYHKIQSKTDTFVKYTFDQEKLYDISSNAYHGKQADNIGFAEGKKGKALSLQGGKSYFTTELKHLGPEHLISFAIRIDGDAEGEQVILESDKVSLKAVQKGTGKLGYSLEGYGYSFDYTLPKNEWIDVKIKALENKTELYINGKLVDTLGLGFTGNKYASLVTPLARVGSKTNALKGLLDEFSILRLRNDVAEPINPKDFIITSDNENDDGRIINAFDNNLETIWHTKWSPTKKSLPATIMIDLRKEMTIDKLGYIARQRGNNNGDIKHYQLSSKLREGDEFTLVHDGRFASTKAKQFAEFAPVKARYLQLKVLEGEAGFGSAAEFFLYEHDLKKKLAYLVKDYAKISEHEQYKEKTWAKFSETLQSAKGILDEENLSEEKLSEAIEALKLAFCMLEIKEVDLDNVDQAEPKGLSKEVMTDSGEIRGRVAYGIEYRTSSLRNVAKDKVPNTRTESNVIWPWLIILFVVISIFDRKSRIW